MNEKLAALKVYCLWAGIEARSLNRKKDYPLYKELRFNEEAQECTWCEMVGQGNGDIDELLCRKCPLWKNNYWCCNRSSLYSQWRLYDSMKKAAGDIAAIAWKEYKRLGG